MHRSNVRLDVNSQVLSDVKWISHCECCKNSKDYDILHQLRVARMIKNTCITSQDAYHPSPAVNIEGHEEEEEEDYDYLLDEVIENPFEQERRDAMTHTLQQMKLAESFHLGVHVEDSVTHIQSLLQQGHSIVCHLYDPHLKQCGQVDLFLETLATTYMGTFFRRVPLAISHHFASTLNIPFDSPRLVCCKDKRVVNHTELTIFGDGNQLYTEDVEKYLHHTHILSVDIPLLLFNKMTTQQGKSRQEEDPLEEEAYCTEPGCGRKFSHEHVGKGSFSFLSSSEALDANAMRRL
jgi:hypothetical protein